MTAVMVVSSWRGLLFEVLISLLLLLLLFAYGARTCIVGDGGVAEILFSTCSVHRDDRWCVII